MTLPDRSALFDELPEQARLGLAVSGGPDSLALLLLAAEARPGLVRAATVDHGLRPEARGEAAVVADVCSSMGVPHDILEVTVSGNVQAGARAARYAALGDWCEGHELAWLGTGHHADDQAETVLMRLARGAGLTGLAGVRRVRPLRPGVTLVRPLIEWRKSQLEALVRDAGLVPAVDPSNTDPAFDRTAVRALLSQTNLFDPARLGHSAANLAEADAALEWATDRAFAERVDGDSLDPNGLPAEIVRRLVLRIFARFGSTPRGPELARLISALRAGRPATLAGLKASAGQRWRFDAAPARRFDH